MQRRTMLKRIGATSTAAVGYAGSVSAESGPKVQLDRKLDVSDVSGVVELDALLEEDAQLPAGVDPAEEEFYVSEGVEVLNPNDCSGCTTDECCFACDPDGCAYWCECCVIERC